MYSSGKFCPMPDAERDALAPAELDAYNAVLDAAGKAEIDFMPARSGS